MSHITVPNRRGHTITRLSFSHRSIIRVSHPYHGHDLGRGVSVDVAHGNAGAYLEECRLWPAGHDVSVASAENVHLARRVRCGDDIEPYQAVDASRRRGVYLVLEGGRISVDAIGFDGEYRRLGTMGFDFQDELWDWTGRAALDPRSGEWVGVAQGDEARRIRRDQR